MILAQMRAKLDQAITYGTKKDALGLAGKGLKEAKIKNLSGEVEYFKGQIQLLKRNFVSAIEHFDAAIRIDAHDGGSYNDRALSMVELGILDQALEYFDKGIEVEPDYATIYHNKGWLLNNLGRHSEAIICFNKALDLEPGRAVTYDNLADACFNLGDLPRALDCYRKVLKLLKPACCMQIKKQIRLKVREIEESLKKVKKK